MSEAKKYINVLKNGSPKEVTEYLNSIDISVLTEQSWGEAYPYDCSFTDKKVSWSMVAVNFNLENMVSVAEWIDEKGYGLLDCMFCMALDIKDLEKVEALLLFVELDDCVYEENRFYSYMETMDSKNKEIIELIYNNVTRQTLYEMTEEVFNMYVKLYPLRLMFKKNNYSLLGKSDHLKRIKYILKQVEQEYN